MSDRPDVRPVPRLARTSARKRADMDDGTNDGTSAERHTDGEREYHLQRIINNFKATISPDNARQLRRLLGVDNADPE